MPFEYYDPAKHGPPPTVWGRTATWEEDEPFIASFSHWLCPHCGANLYQGTLDHAGATQGYYCLNACHLTAPSYVTFQRGLHEAVAAVKARDIAQAQGRKSGD